MAVFVVRKGTPPALSLIYQEWPQLLMGLKRHCCDYSLMQKSNRRSTIIPEEAITQLHTVVKLCEVRSLV
jgi:hypothetical protein